MKLGRTKAAFQSSGRHLFSLLRESRKEILVAVLIGLPVTVVGATLAGCWLVNWQYRPNVTYTYRDTDNGGELVVTNHSSVPAYSLHAHLTFEGTIMGNDQTPGVFNVQSGWMIRDVFAGRNDADFTASVIPPREAYRIRFRVAPKTKPKVSMTTAWGAVGED
jgi:hypothetical protein